MVFDRCIINNEVIFDVNMSELQPLGDNGECVTLNAPTARCLQILLENNGRVISREEFLEAVWKNRGIIVSQNTFYQNISLLRKSLNKAGLSQDIVVTVRQRGFVLASGVHIASFMRNDEAESTEPLNVKAIKDTCFPSIERKNVSQPLAAGNIKGGGNIHGKKKVVFTLPAWLLILLIVMAVANIFSLFL